MNSALKVTSSPYFAWKMPAPHSPHDNPGLGSGGAEDTHGGVEAEL